MIASDVNLDSFSSNNNKAPKFHPTIAYAKWLRDFKAYVVRHKECAFVLDNPSKPTKSTQPRGQSSRKKTPKKFIEDNGEEHANMALRAIAQIGRASCRERV